MTSVVPLAGEMPGAIIARASLLLALAWLAAEALRWSGRSAATRHLAWLLGIVALLLLPPFAAVLPPLSIPVLPPWSDAPLASSAEVGAGHASWWEVARAIYLAGLILLVLRLAAARWKLARLWRSADPIADERLSSHFQRLSAQLGVSRRSALRLSDAEPVPMTWGTLAPRILLPAEAVRWTNERQRHVLLHELAHVARRDSLGQCAASLACAIYWLHPGIWLAARRLRIEQEHAADDMVLMATDAPRDYARSLLELAMHATRPASRLPLTAGMARPSQLEVRLLSILSKRSRRRPALGTGAASAAIALVGTAVIAAAAPATATQPPQPYEEQLQTYNRQLADYRHRLAGYSVQLRAWQRAVDDLRRQSKLANSGNSGNSGNPGGTGRAATPPTAPIPPTPPTGPTPVTPPAPVAPVWHGP